MEPIKLGGLGAVLDGPGGGGDDIPRLSVARFMHVAPRAKSLPGPEAVR